MIWKILSNRENKDIIDVLLKNRGIKRAKEKREFLDPTSPEKLGLKALGISELEINKAIKRIKKALKTKEKVVVYGDYDADGICGTAILWEALYNLGLNVLPYIPERFSEGYGINAKSVENLKFKIKNLKLIITVDNGTVAYEAVETANKLGIDVIITDHHETGKIKPKACATIHTTKISGSTVAWILARELGVVGALELTAIGTIADQLPLIGPNRSFVKHGLEALNKTKRPGLLALFEEAGIGFTPRSPKGEVGTYEIGFIIAPRLNAMGRLVHAIDSLRLLCTKNKARAKELANLIGKTNSQRQKIVEEVLVHTLRQVRAKPSQNIIILAHESYHEGVIGLAAAKLVEEFYRPAIVLAKKEKISKASARSISGFNIFEAIRKLEHLYIEGGGHPMAAGFSIETSKIEIFSKEINRLAKPLLTEEILSRKLKIDLEIDFNRINHDLYKKLTEFEPTGLGNFTPLFCTRKVKVIDARTVGRDNSHLKLKLEQDSVAFDAIGFGLAKSYQLKANSLIDIAYSIEDNFWNGAKNLQLKVKDIKVIR